MKLREFCKSKIQNAVITQANLRYSGSLTVDKKILDAANILAGEKIQVVNLDNGKRFETYTIEGEEGSGVIGLNGPAVYQGEIGQSIHIISYWQCTEEEEISKPLIVELGKKNEIL